MSAAVGRPGAFAHPHKATGDEAGDSEDEQTKTHREPSFPGFSSVMPGASKPARIKKGTN